MKVIGWKSLFARIEPDTPDLKKCADPNHEIASKVYHLKEAKPLKRSEVALAVLNRDDPVLVTTVADAPSRFRDFTHIDSTASGESNTKNHSQLRPH